MLLTIVSNMQLISEELVFDFNSLNKVNYCGNSNSKNVLFTLNIGEVKPEDNLEYIGFEINYDISKYKINFVLTSSTFLDEFEYKNYSIINSEGIIVVDAGFNSIGKKISGNKPLLAFSGTYIGEDCLDSGFITIRRVLLNEEYSKKDIRVNDFKITEQFFDTKVNDYTIKTENDTIVYDSTEFEKIIPIKIELKSEFKSILGKFAKKLNDNYIIENIEINDSNLILAKDEINDTIIYKITNNDAAKRNIEILATIKKIENREDLIKINFGELNFGDCNCNKIQNNELGFIKQLKEIKDTTDSNNTSISKLKRIEPIYKLENKILQVFNNDLDLKEVKIWNLNGSLIHNIKMSESTNMIISLNEIEAKLILTQFIYKDNTYYTKKMILE